MIKKEIINILKKLEISLKNLRGGL